MKAVKLKFRLDYCFGKVKSESIIPLKPKQGSFSIYLSISNLVLPLSLLFILANFYFSFGQIKNPQTPQFEHFNQIDINPNYSNNNLNQSTYGPPVSTYPMGATADDIIKQVNQNARQNMGVTTPTVPPSDPNERINFNGNQNLNSSKNYQQQKELLDIINEAHADAKFNQSEISYFKSPDFAMKSKSYNDALQNLKDMLTGGKKLSVAQAYFEIENAYGNSYLSQKQYNQIIKQSVDFIKTWLAQNNFSSNDNEALHYGIQKFMSDTLSITKGNPDSKSPPEKITHLPFFYDYNDFKAEKDFRNYFTTKCFATGSGQCNNLPAVYLSLSEGLGAKSYLSFAPQHSFIKFPDNSGHIYNYEPTSNWKISDEWYADNLFISPAAKASGIYLDTLNRKQVVANCILDLAFGYLNKFGAADGEFIKECVSTSLQYFPKGNNIEAYFIYSSLLARQLDRELYQNNITDLKDIHKLPEAEKLYKALLHNEKVIKKLGYQDTPEELYQQLMKQHEFEGRKQEEKNISGKEKRNLFIKSNF